MPYDDTYLDDVETSARLNFANINMSDLDVLMGIDNLDAAQTNALFGLNTSYDDSPIQAPVYNKGYVFMSRPQLNLQSDNIMRHDHLSQLLSPDPTSMQRAIICLLDPFLIEGYKNGTGEVIGNLLKCPLINNKLAWNTILGNTMKDVTGLPDYALGDFTTTPDRKKGSWSQIDDIYEHNEILDISIPFRNTLGEIGLTLIKMWMIYGSALYQGHVTRYPNYRLSGVMDYVSSLFIIKTDASDSKITKLTALGPGYPVGVSNAQGHNFSSEEYIDGNDTVTAQFKFHGVRYDSVTLAHRFNETNMLFNENMINPKATMTEVAPRYKEFFKYRLYPHIDIDTWSLKWYADTTYYNNKIAKLKQKLYK